MFKCILKCEYSSCTSVHISLGPAWACGCVQTDGNGLKHDGPTKITQTGYPAYALSVKGRQKINPNNNELRAGRQTLVQRQTESDLSFGMSFVFTLAWPLSFTNIKCQSSSTDWKMKKKDCCASRKLSHTNTERWPYLSSQEEPGFFGLLVWVLVPALSNQSLRNVELPADIPYLFSPKTIHFASFPAHISLYLYSPAQRKTVALRSCSYQEFSVILHFINFSQIFLLEFLRRYKNRDNRAMKSG